MELLKFYTDKNNYISFLPPAGWTKEEQTGGDPRTTVSFFYKDEQNSSVVFLTLNAYHTQSMRSLTALKQYFKKRITFLYRNTACSAAPIGSIMLGDISCLYTEADMNTTRSLLIICQHDSGLCIDIAYSAGTALFERYKKQALDSLETIVILKKAYSSDAATVSAQNTYLLKKEIALLLSDEKYLAAYEILRELIKEKTDDSDLLFQMGIAHARLHYDASALRFFSRALRLKPDFWQALFEIGKLHLHANRLTEAEKSFAELLSINPCSINALLNLALIYKRQGKLRKAVKAYKKILCSLPKNTAVLADMGKAYFELEKYDNARKWYERCVKLDASNPKALVNLARCYLALSYFREAEIICKKALLLAPNLYLAHKMLNDIRELNSNA